MESFRTELENPIVQKDIVELEKKIYQSKHGLINDDSFRSLRLARGIYGQRQPGVQIIRIKIPFGKLTASQLEAIANVSDEYSNGNLHLTTRQDVQIHFVSLDKTPELWAKLEQNDITLREACGNTVRNITASDIAGIDPLEPFDVSPYADAMFKYFLRSAHCQELRRKIKISFSSSEEDSALSFIHDLGFIPKILVREGRELKGFKVMIGGGLGAQPFKAQVAYEFLEVNKIIPFAEAVLRVFDRHGERQNRNKARLKYLLHKIGLEQFMQLVQEEYLALRSHDFIVSVSHEDNFESSIISAPYDGIGSSKEYLVWRKSNVIAQKQPNFVAVRVRIPLGNLNTVTARKLAGIVRKYAKDDLRIGINQSLLLRFVRVQSLESLYLELKGIGLEKPGASSLADITSCPGTDTCNLGISNSTQVALAFESLIEKEFPQFVYPEDIKIKISGCMNSCSQHGMANIGFHGSSIKLGSKVVPALQLLLGGGVIGKGEGRTAERVIKFPSKRALEVLRTILNDFVKHGEGDFNQYYDERGKKYFYELLKPFSQTSELKKEEFVDWGREELFSTQIGVGECAGVVVDLVETLLYEAEEKLDWSETNMKEGAFADAIYHAYSASVHAAKASLLDKQVSCRTHQEIIEKYDDHFKDGSDFSFEKHALAIKANKPEEHFALNYFEKSKRFVHAQHLLRREQLVKV